ncbi:HD domain-containing phosphohydrolase [Paraglaciecola sp.]
MEKVAENILYQEKCFNGEGIPMDDIKGTQIPLGARMLKVVIDFIRFEKQEQSTEKAYSLLEQQRQYYDPKILAAFKESLNIVVEVPTVIIELSKLKENMIINTNLLTTRNQLVARKGQKVTETLLHIIKHCLENKAIKGKVQIIENEE